MIGPVIARPANRHRGTAYLHDAQGACVAVISAAEGRDNADAWAEALAGRCNLIGARGAELLDLLETAIAAAGPGLVRVRLEAIRADLVRVVGAGETTDA